MNPGPGPADTEALSELGARLVASLRQYHRGLARLEVECFMLPPFTPVDELVPAEVAIEPDGEDVLLVAAPWWFRCRRDEGGRWQVTAAGRTCLACKGSGACAECAASADACSCSGTGLCGRCQGIGKLIFF